MKSEVFVDICIKVEHNKNLNFEKLADQIEAQVGAALERDLEHFRDIWNDSVDTKEKATVEFSVGEVRAYGWECDEKNL